MEQQDLAYTQGIRKRIVENFIKPDKLDQDLKALTLVQKLLKDIDSQVISVARLKADENNAKSQQRTNELIAQTLLAIAPDALKHDLADAVCPTTAGEELGERTYVAGEMDSGTKPETIDEFNARRAAELENKQ